MRFIIVKVPWNHGLNLRPAALIAQCAHRFRSRVILKKGGLFSEATSILGLVVLCAALSSAVRIEVEGVDEQEALEAVAACFESDAVD